MRSPRIFLLGFVLVILIGLTFLSTRALFRSGSDQKAAPNSESTSLRGPTAKSSVAASPVGPADRDKIVAEYREWNARRWGQSFFDDALVLISDRSKAIELRRFVLELLAAKTGIMSDEQLTRFLARTVGLTKNATEPPGFVAVCIPAMTRLFTIVEDKQLLSRGEIAQQAAFLIDFARDRSREFMVRSQAIHAVGILDLKSGLPVIEAIVADPKNINIPDLLRSGCLSLVRLDPEKAVPAVSQVLSATSDPAVFGTAAFCLGTIKSEASLSALLKNSGRFPDASEIGAALVDFDNVVQSILEDIGNPTAVEAITATKFLWRDGQEARYLPLLRRLVATGSTEVRSAALARLIEQARSRGFDEEKKILADLIAIAGTQRNLAVQAESIRRRLTATVLTPNGATETTPPRTPTGRGPGTAP